MNRLSLTLQALQHIDGPALTWYGQYRSELTGGAAARWITKAVNLLGGDLSPALMGEDRPGTYVLDMPCSWQRLMWEVSAWAMGWTQVEVASEADLVVSDRADSGAAIEGAENGAWVLLHDLAPLAFRWNGAIPDGMLDSLSELMAQSDLVEVEGSSDRSVAFDEGGAEAEIREAKRVVMKVSRDCCSNGVNDGLSDSAALALRAWLAGTSVVFVDTDASDSSMESIATAEGARIISTENQ
ncbi:MAG: TIGR03089 family protein [Actinomycetaceae bacterium]|nr:TIGR03089 family protein [Actinomycetaceae bacterium]